MDGSLANRFAHHPPRDASVADRHARVRVQALALALEIESLLPAGAAREKATAITKVEEAMMWANAGIARHS